MGLLRITDPEKFKKFAYDYLIRHEAENCLILGVLDDWLKRPDFYQDFYFWVILENDETVGVCWYMAPNPFGVTRMPSTAVQLVIDELVTIQSPPSSIVGPTETVALLKSAWESARGVKLKKKFSQRIFQNSKVISPAMISGEIRIANQSDLDRLIDWNMKFVEDCKLGRPIYDNAKKMAERCIIDGNRYFWIAEGTSVSMVGVGGKTPNGIRVSWVYTPPEFRGHGYASAVVAEVTKKMINEGNQFCFLYTDLANPTSNSIYQKLGYRPVADSEVYEVDNCCSAT
jgi:ribosomal protein S18 acetylase RimI-like enzyme